MKTLSSVMLASLSIVCGLDARIVTLTLGGNKTNDSLTIRTNESLTIVSAAYGGNGLVVIEKDGATLVRSIYEFDPIARFDQEIQKLIRASASPVQ